MREEKVVKQKKKKKKIIVRTFNTCLHTHTHIHSHIKRYTIDHIKRTQLIILSGFKIA